MPLLTGVTWIMKLLVLAAAYLTVSPNVPTILQRVTSFCLTRYRGCKTVRLLVRRSAWREFKSRVASDCTLVLHHAISVLPPQRRPRLFWKLALVHGRLYVSFSLLKLAQTFLWCISGIACWHYNYYVCYNLWSVKSCFFTFKYDFLFKIIPSKYFRRP